MGGKILGDGSKPSGKVVPTPLKLLRGNPGQRKVKPEIKWRKDGTIPAPPRFLKGAARDEWLRVSTELHRLGLLTGADLHAFAAYCVSFARWVEAEEAVLDENGKTKFSYITDKGNQLYNPDLAAARQAMADMVKYACEFGLTPASRSRIATAADDGDEMGGLLAG